MKKSIIKGGCRWRRWWWRWSQLKPSYSYRIGSGETDSVGWA